MNFWRSKVAVITGAGSGIGSQIAHDLIKHGMTVIGLDYNDEKIQTMTSKLEEYSKLRYPGQLVPYKCDVSISSEVENAFSKIVKDHGGVDVMVNNAAIAIDGFFSTGCLKSLKKVMDTNIFGMVVCTNLAVDSMRKRDARGHIININSICGHYIPAYSSPKINMYVLSKHAMTAFTEVLRQEFRYLKLNIKVTSISPGVVATGIFEAANSSVIDHRFLAENPHMQPEDVSASVLHALAAPPHIQHHEILLHALHETY